MEQLNVQKGADRHWKSLFRLQTIRLGSDHNLVDNLWRCRRGLVIGRYLATRHFWHLVSKIDAKFTLTCCFRSLGRGSIHLKTFLLISHDQTFLGVSCEVLWQKNFWKLQKLQSMAPPLSSIFSSHSALLSDGGCWIFLSKKPNWLLDIKPFRLRWSTILPRIKV